MKFLMNEAVQTILKKLHNSGHEAYIVGGCVRDMILGQTPHDIDITTSAEPLEVKAIFSKTIDTGLQHGTVTVIMDGEGYEVTTYRIDGTYLDNRRPESVEFTKSLSEDLKRRDFTINAMAYSDEDGVVDLYGGVEDLDKGLIRCVGQPRERFTEDALRMLRAIRFAARFGFEIDPKTEEAIVDLGHLINNISAERIHMELSKTLTSPNPTYIERLVTYELLEHVLPEFQPNVGLEQNHPYHVYSVDQHTYKCLNYVEADEALRWAIYLHDIGKGYKKTTDDQGIDHFHGHPKVSVELSRTILNRLKFDNKTKDKILKLIDYHDYRFKATPKSVRKAVAKIGSDLFDDYLKVQYADIHGQAPDKLAVRVHDLEAKRNYFQEMLDLNQCTTVKDLKVNGSDLIKLGIKPGKEIGQILEKLLEEVIERPTMNTKEALMAIVHLFIGHVSDHKEKYSDESCSNEGCSNEGSSNEEA